MSDNVTKLKNIGPEKKRLLILGIVGFLVLAVLAFVLFPKTLNLDGIGRRIRYGSEKKQVGYGTVTYDAHSSNRFVCWEDGLALASVGGVETFYEEGAKLIQKTMSLNAPALQQGGDITLCYDIGGSLVMAIRDGRQTVLEHTTEGVLFDADVSSKGAVCTAASESGHKTVLRVYDTEQQEVYRWFSASQYMPLCAVSPNGKQMAAVALGQEDGAFVSTAYFFKTTSEEPEKTVSLGGNLVYDLRFVEDNKLCVVKEDAVVWMNTAGSELGTFDLSDWYLEDYDFSGDGFAMLSLNKYKAGDRCSVVTVDHNGNQLGSLFVGAEVLDISVCGKYAAILTTENLMICYNDLTEYRTVPNSWMATEVLMRGDGTAYLLTANAAELFIP